jgi:UTP--glucose-1-phosphate uridylyltransferase
VRSDCFELDGNWRLGLNPERRRRHRPETIRINLDPKHYGKIDQFEARFRDGIPSLVDCEMLRIEGDVRFEAGVTISGRVNIRNPRSGQQVISTGCRLDRDVTF